jgi:hypothetical protein
LTVHLVKTVTIILCTAVLVNRFSFPALFWSIVGISLYHLVVRPVLVKARIRNFSAFEEMAETVILVSIDNAGFGEIITKVIGLAVYYALIGDRN